MTLSGLPLSPCFRKSVRSCGYSERMDRLSLPAPAVAVAQWWARWVLLGAVIAGVVAMHVLSEPEGFDGHSMPAGMVIGARMAVAVDAPVMPAMTMTGTTAETGFPATQPAVTGVAADMMAPAPVGMSGMTCCTLFLLTGTGILLVMLLLRVFRRQPDLPLGCEALQHFWQRGRAGPWPLPDPRTVLCVLRV